MQFAIRPAIAADLPAINAIYNHYVTHSTCTYQDHPTSDAERRAWFEAHGPKHPVTVAATPHNEVLAWASLSPFHTRSAYRMTVENSIYVHHLYLRQGLGKALLLDLLCRAQSLGHRQVIALISADQPGSIALHHHAGFAEAGRLRNVGYKFNQFLDVVYLQYPVPQPT